MPRKPQKPCAYPGCPNLCDKDYCEVHKRVRTAEYERYGRNPEHSARYNRNWQRIRTAYVQAHPLCERCAKAGRYVAVEEVHHIVPLNEGGTNSTDNLMSLCRNCHAEIHAEMGTRSHRNTVYEVGGRSHAKQSEGE